MIFRFNLMKIKNTLHIHRQHRGWLSELEFIQDEMQYFKKKLLTYLQSESPSHLAPEAEDLYREIQQWETWGKHLKESIHTHDYYISYFKKNRLHEGKVLHPSHEGMEVKVKKYILRYQQFKQNCMQVLKMSLKERRG